MGKLIRCTTCGGKVSRNAERCPHCGEPVAVILEERRIMRRNTLLVLGTLSTLVLVIALFVDTSTITRIVPYTVRTTSNLRAGPGTDYQAVRTVQPGDTVWLLGYTSDSIWARVLHQSDTLWLHAGLIYSFDSLEARKKAEIAEEMARMRREVYRKRFDRIKERMRLFASEYWYRYLTDLELSGGTLLIVYTSLLPAGEPEQRTARIICHQVYAATRDLGVQLVSVRDYRQAAMARCP